MQIVMRLKSPNLFKFASMGLIGLAFAHAVHAATIVHAVGDPSFGAAVAGGGTYSYATSASWSQNANWFYNTAYGAKRPYPRTGDVALHGISQYTAQVLTDTFVAGRTYTFSMYLSGDGDASGDSDRTWMYIFDRTTTPGAFSEGSELVRARWISDGTVDSLTLPTGTGATSVTSEGWSIGTDAGDWVAGGGTWGLATLSYTATAAEDGHQIGIAMWGGGDAAWDDVGVTSTPEPSISMLFALSGGLLLRRRRKTS
jgi:hypothetical protein